MRSCSALGVAGQPGQVEMRWTNQWTTQWQWQAGSHWQPAKTCGTSLGTEEEEEEEEEEDSENGS